jgi:hypothetical protein
MKFYCNKLMMVSLFETFVVSSKSSLRLISGLRCDGVICRLFGLGSETGTEGPGMMLSGGVCLMETIEEESEADRSE